MATVAHLYIDQGSDFTAEFTLENDDGTPMNLTSFTPYSQFRKNYGSIAGYSFTVTVTNAFLGNILLSLPGAQSSTIKPGRYMYDVEIVSSVNQKTRVVEGVITINPEITRLP